MLAKLFHRSSSFCWKAWRVLSLAGCLIELTLLTAPAIAQVVADPSVGTIVTSRDTRYEITGGTTVGGRNLFHSFSRFDVPEAGSAHFLNVPGITNIFSRVTGGTTSQINGLIQTQGTANLFLLNPSGIVFGRGAQLNVGGSFVATTANALQFPGGAEFSLSSPVESQNSLLAVNPSAFLFNQIAAQPIVNRSSTGLQVPNGKSLLLIGGNVNLENGSLFAHGGRVELGGLADQGSVGLQEDGNLLHLQFPTQVTRSDVSINNYSQVIVRGNGGGDVAMNARNLAMSNHSFVRAGIDFSSGSLDAQAGNVEVNADTVTLSNVGAISNNVEAGGVGKAGVVTINANRLSLMNGSQLQVLLRGANYIPGLPGAQGTGGTLNLNISGPLLIGGSSADGFTSAIFSSIGGFSRFGYGTAKGKGGDINIRAGSLIVQDDASIVSSTHGKGDAGNVFIQVQGNAVFSKGFVFADVNANGVGKAGKIVLQAQSLTLKNGSRISSGIYPPEAGRTGGQGQGSSIQINTTDFVDISGLATGISADTGHDTTGRGGDILINTNAFRIRNGGAINTDTFNASNAGDITINAKTVSALNNGRIVAATHASGNAGTITINATSSLTIGGSGPAFGSEQFLNIIGPGGSVPDPDRSLPSAIYANAIFTSTGNGGNIVLNTTRLNLFAGGKISAQSQGTGRAGNVEIAANGNFKAQDGSILTSAKSGGGGNIEIAAHNMLLQGNSDIRTDLAQGQGSGGNIALKANTIVALNDSDILAFASQGRGGNITFNTHAFLSSPLYHATTQANLTKLDALDGNNQIDINASGAVTGSVVGVPDTTFLQNSLTQLPQTLSNAEALLANSCIVRTNHQQGNFYITGANGLPERPGDLSPAAYATGEVRSVPTTADSSSAKQVWHRGDPIVEPQQVYRLATGQLVMSRECSN